MSRRWDVSTSLWVSVTISETDLLTELLRCSSLLEVPLSKDDLGATLTAVESVEENNLVLGRCYQVFNVPTACMQVQL